MRDLRRIDKKLQEIKWCHIFPLAATVAIVIALGIHFLAKEKIQLMAYTGPNLEQPD